MLWITICLSLFGTSVVVFLWQVKRWSDARPSLDFIIAGGETSEGQLFGVKIRNHGSIPAHKPAMFASWQNGSLWQTTRVNVDANQYISLQLTPQVQAVEVDQPRIWMDFCDEFGRLYRVQRQLVQRWDAKHHKFFLDEQAGSRKSKRPHWLKDLFRWRKVQP